MGTMIIGATGGIGSAVARAWPREALWLSGRDEDRLGTLAQELQATSCRVDVGYESHVRAMFESVTLPLETIVYAAGAVAPEALRLSSPESTRRVWNANYFGVLWTLKYGLPKLAPGGRVYVIGARPDLVMARGFSQYAASKAAVARALDIARLEHPDFRFTLVLPPAVATPLWEAVGRVPRGAIPPEQVARVVIEDRFEGAGTAELVVG